MNVRLAIQGVIDKDSVQEMIAVSVQIARSLEGQYTNKAISSDSITSIIKVSGDTALVLISTESSGIILHPRAGYIDPVEYYIGRYDAESGTHFDTYTLNGIKGGWTNGTTPLTTSYLYPLVDEDNASFMITANEPADGDFVGTSGNYGNLHWYNGDPDDPKFLSWKGPPNRHIECSDLVNIPGTSTHFCWSQHDVTGDAPRYTAFSTNVYQNGEAVIGPKFSWPYMDELKGQTLILGAAIGQADGDIYVVTASDQRFAKLYYRVFSNGYVLETDDKQKADSYATEHPGVTLTYSIDLPKPPMIGDKQPDRGKYIQIWNNNGPINGWKLLFQSECEDNSINLPWFADATGTGFTCSNGATISPSGVNEAYFPKGSFSQTAMVTTVNNTDGSSSTSGGAVSCSGVGYGYHEAGISSLVNYSATSTTNKVTGARILKDYAGDTIEELGIDPEVSIAGPSVLAGTGSYPNIVTTAGQEFTAGGGTAPYSFSASFAGTVSGSTFTTTGGDKPCGTGTITVTDACGKTASLDVRMPNGTWIIVEPDCGIDFWPSYWQASSYYGTSTPYGINWYHEEGEYRWYVVNISYLNDQCLEPDTNTSKYPNCHRGPTQWYDGYCSTGNYYGHPGNPSDHMLYAKTDVSCRYVQGPVDNCYSYFETFRCVTSAKMKWVC